MRMSSGSTPHTSDLSDADRRILRYLARETVEYPALIASNTGLHIPLVERRCRSLAADGLLEAVSEEAVYRLTDRGRAVALR